MARKQNVVRGQEPSGELAITITHPQVIQSLHIPRWVELPGIDLYMDQVLIVIGDVLRPFTLADTDAATSTMINNYVKMHLIDAPAKKKYSRAQVARLIMISALKRVLSMAQIAAVFTDADKYGDPQQTYDRFCGQVEAGLIATEAAVATEELEKKPESPDESPVLQVAAKALIDKFEFECVLARESGEWSEPEQPVATKAVKVKTVPAEA